MSEAYYTYQEGIIFWKDIKPISTNAEFRTLTFLNENLDEMIDTFNRFIYVNFQLTETQFFIASTTGYPFKTLSKLWEIQAEKDLRQEKGAYSLKKHVSPDGIVFTKIREVLPTVTKTILENLSFRRLFIFSSLSRKIDIEKLQPTIFANPTNPSISNFLSEYPKGISIRVDGDKETYFALQFIFRKDILPLQFVGKETTREQYVKMLINKFSSDTNH